MAKSVQPETGAGEGGSTGPKSFRATRRADIYDRIEAIAAEYDATVGQTKRADGTRTITVNLDAPKGE